jgi:hypothetical protein
MLIFFVRNIFPIYFLGHATHGFPDKTRSIIFHPIMGEVDFIGFGVGEIDFDWTVNDGVTVFCLNTIFMKN